jgi:PIN domain nuclease of toxin-antitoxin system
MPSASLDASAVIALLPNEPGADQVAQIIGNTVNLL